MTVLAGVVGGTLVATALTKTTRPTTRPWVTGCRVKAPTTWACPTTPVNSATDATSFRRACVKLQGDLGHAHSDPAMPLSSLQSQWPVIPCNLSTAANDCVKGIDQQDSNLLNTTHNHMSNAGEAYLKLVKAVQQAGG